MRAIWSIAALDLKRWRRTPIAIASALVPPATMAMLLVVLSIAVTQQPVALVVNGHGENADQMTQVIKSDDDAYLLTLTDERKALQLLHEQLVAAVIVVPADFDDMIKQGKIASVKLLLNNVDIDFADDIRRSVARSVYRFDLDKEKPPKAEELAAARQPEKAIENPADEAKENALFMRAARADNPYLIKIEEEDLRKTNVHWLDYQVVPVLVLLVLNVGLVGTALLSAQDIENRSATLLLLSPQPAPSLLLGRLLGGFIASMVALIPALALCAICGTVAPPPAHWPALIAIFAATAVFASGLGAAIGATMCGTRNIALAACVLATYMFLLGGGFTTIAFLPDWLRQLSSLVPARYAIDGMRQALFYNTLDGIPADLTILCLAAVLSCLLGSFFVRRAWR
jgi:ABC-type polysaccharide/polyol phosphate export permease